ncbi:MAG: HAMP domain-containing histidine kinase [Alphaproteobacteria bacterium]|nr:HAMP domain-containing histidine kinase [Alphaproteobacteria bacterium]
MRALLDDALRVNSAKSEFLAHTSHELRTPLNAIIGFAELLQIKASGRLDPRERGYLDDIVQAAFHLQAVIQGILDFSRLEAGKLPLAEEPARLAEAVEASLRLVRKQAESKRIALSHAAEPALRVLADPTKLRQICTNLLSNAVKFTKPGGTIRVEAGEDAAGPFIRVADSGVGMAAEDIERAQKPYMRVADNPFVARESGIGLGLPIAKALTELHGGTLEIQSAPGEGTRVTMRLPATRRLA